MTIWVMRSQRLRNRSPLTLSKSRNHQATAATVVAVFTQVNSLPGSEGESAGRYGEAETAAHQRRFDVGGHVIGALERVHEWEVFGANVIQSRFEVCPYIRIGIFIQGKRCGCVENKNVA